LTPRLAVEAATDALERIRADVFVVGVAPTDRPLRGAAAYADWRLCGELWKRVRSGRIVGLRGEAGLVIGTGIPCRQLLVVGLGPRRSLDVAAWREIGRDSAARALALRAESVAMAVARDGMVASEPTHRHWIEVTNGLIDGAESAVRARDASLRLILPGLPVGVLEDAPIPAGVEVRTPAAHSAGPFQPSHAGTPTPNSRRV